MNYMGFTRALYYPTIDIRNWDWTKSAALFWDNIQTIVPETMGNPYEERITRILSDEGILTPYHVNPDLDIVRDLTSEVTEFIDTNEGIEYLTNARRDRIALHQEKLPSEIRRLIGLHSEKLPREVQRYLDRNRQRGDWVEVDSRFAGFYMSLLANKICEHERMVLLTDDSLASRLTEKAKFDNQVRLGRRGDLIRNESNVNLSQGVLSNLALQGIRFSPDTTVEKILEFKRTHQDELGLFRNNLERLVSEIPDDLKFEQVQRHVEDIYINEFKPEYNNFKKALDGFRLKWINDHVMKIAFFRGGTGALLPFILGATIPQALLAGAGISIITSVISYNQQKQEMLRENPYSYLVSAENQLSRDDFRRAIRNRIY